MRSEAGEGASGEALFCLLHVAAITGRQNHFRKANYFSQGTVEPGRLAARAGLGRWFSSAARCGKGTLPMRKIMLMALFLGGVSCCGLGCGSSGSSIVNQAAAMFLRPTAQQQANQQVFMDQTNGTQQSPTFSQVGATYPK
jgi:hypothetical protein